MTKRPIDENDAPIDVDFEQMRKLRGIKTPDNNIRILLLTFAMIVMLTAAGCATGRISNTAVLMLVFVASAIGIVLVFGRNGGFNYFARWRRTPSNLPTITLLVVGLVLVVGLLVSLWPFSRPSFGFLRIRTAKIANTSVPSLADAINAEAQNGKDITQLRIDFDQLKIDADATKGQVDSLANSVDTAEESIDQVKSAQATLSTQVSEFVQHQSTTVVMAAYSAKRADTRRIVKTENYTDPVTGQKYNAIFKR
jgi:hypothetical protein